MLLIAAMTARAAIPGQLAALPAADVIRLVPDLDEPEPDPAPRYFTRAPLPLSVSYVVYGDTFVENSRLGREHRIEDEKTVARVSGATALAGAVSIYGLIEAARSLVGTMIA